jgi:hypothetical protein
LNDLNEKIKTCGTIYENPASDEKFPFDYDKYFYNERHKNATDGFTTSDDEEPTENEHLSFLDYINNYRVNSKYGQIRSKFNIELLFFMNLKNLRLEYMNDLNMLKNFTSPITPSRAQTIENIHKSIPTSKNLTSKAFATATKNEPKLKSIKKSYLPVRILPTTASSQSPSSLSSFSPSSSSSSNEITNQNSNQPLKIQVSINNI